MKGINIRRRRGAYEWEDTKAEAKGRYCLSRFDAIKSDQTGRRGYTGSTMGN